MIVVQFPSKYLISIELRSQIGLADCELNYAFKICKFDIRYVKNEEVPLFLSQKLCNRHNKLKRTLSFDRTSVPSFFFKWVHFGDKLVSLTMFLVVRRRSWSVETKHLQHSTWLWLWYFDCALTDPRVALKGMKKTSWHHELPVIWLLILWIINMVFRCRSWKCGMSFWSVAPKDNDVRRNLNGSFNLVKWAQWVLLWNDWMVHFLGENMRFSCFLIF